MKLKQLMYVVAIADSGLNVTVAAQRLNTSQPGVSKQLQRLEEELGSQIFVRNGKSFVGITKAGEQIIVRARKVVKETERIHSLTQDLIRSGRTDPPSKNGSSGNGSAVVKQNSRTWRVAGRKRRF